MMYATKTVTRRFAALAAAALLSLHAGAVVATDQAPVTGTSEFSNSVTDSDLANDRGTGTPNITNETISEVSATLTGNTATNTISGNNTIGSGVNITGIGSIVQNSGDNVILQTATTVNVTFVNP